MRNLPYRAFPEKSSPMSPAFILVHPGAFAISEGLATFDSTLAELERHHGPIYIIDDHWSADLAEFDARIEAILENANSRGFEAIRMWGCATGAHPYAGWAGELADIHGSPQEALISIAPRMHERDAILAGTGTAAAGNRGRNVVLSLVAMGWGGNWEISTPAVEENRIEDDHEDPDPELHLA